MNRICPAKPAKQIAVLVASSVLALFEFAKATIIRKYESPLRYNINSPSATQSGQGGRPISINSIGFNNAEPTDGQNRTADKPSYA